MSDYTFFAPHYDSLMRDAEYEKRAEYLLELFSRFRHDMGITLDVACGTGTLTLMLKKKGVDIYGVDSCEEMLAEAMDKAYDAGEHILYLCQKAQNLNLYGTIQTAVCTFDGVNHFGPMEQLQKAFDKIGFFMDKGGYFVFDMNTVYKHREVLADNTFVYETDDVFCVWQNALDKENSKVSISLDFFEKRGEVYKRESTSFTEWAYTACEISQMLTKAGFDTVSVFDDLSFEEPKEDSQRVIFVAKKREEPGKKIF